MRRVPITKAAPLTAERVSRFAGTRPFLATGAVAANGDLDPEPVTYDARPSRADLIARRGDVCFARMKNTVKVRVFEAADEDLILSTGFAVLRPNPDLMDARYLAHFLRTADFQAAKDRLCSGATQKAITNANIKLLAVPLPPLSEQKRIADTLDRTETLRRDRFAALVKVNTLSQAIFLNLFGDPVVNPKSWAVHTLDQVGTLDRGVSRHRPRNARELIGGPYPLVQTGEVANCDGYIRQFNSTYSELGLRQSKMWPAGTLCITIAANIAKTGILTFDACFPDSVVGFCAEEPATVEYVRVWMSFLQKRLEDAAPEFAQKNINLAILRALKIPVPPIDYQREFARRIAAAERLKIEYRAFLTELETLLMSLRHRAFSRGL